MGTLAASLLQFDHLFYFPESAHVDPVKINTRREILHIQRHRIQAGLLIGFHRFPDIPAGCIIHTQTDCSIQEPDLPDIIFLISI